MGVFGDLKRRFVSRCNIAMALGSDRVAYHPISYIYTPLRKYWLMRNESRDKP
jgi:hypothetical protein